MEFFDESLYFFQACEEPCIRKLGKSIVAATNLETGHVITLQDLKVKVITLQPSTSGLANSLVKSKQGWPIWKAPACGQRSAGAIFIFYFFGICPPPGLLPVLGRGPAY